MSEDSGVGGEGVGSLLAIGDGLGLRPISLMGEARLGSVFRRSKRIRAQGLASRTLRHWGKVSSIRRTLVGGDLSLMRSLGRQSTLRSRFLLDEGGNSG